MIFFKTDLGEQLMRKTKENFDLKNNNTGERYVSPSRLETRTQG